MHIIHTTHILESFKTISGIATSYNEEKYLEHLFSISSTLINKNERLNALNHCSDDSELMHRTNIRGNSIRTGGVKVWNAIKVEIRNKISIECKACLIQMYN